YCLSPDLKLAKVVATLNNLQKLLDTINWVRPILGMTTKELSPLFSLLQGDPNLTSP
ncbi:POK19 protein, partial [Probosciger aterrimus]|nr:POK19 protein [Probosciger aterrimus]